jgi:hypothetical protein
MTHKIFVLPMHLILIKLHTHHQSDSCPFIVVVMAIFFLNSPRGPSHPRRRGLLRPHSGPYTPLEGGSGCRGVGHVAFALKAF